MKLLEKGIVYKTSRIAYISNYVLVVLVAVLFYLAFTSFNLTFTLTPTNSNELISVFVIFGFLILASFLLDQPVFEQIIRQYVVTETDVIKIEGILSKKRTLIPLQNIGDIQCKKGIIGRIFNFGDIEIVGFKEQILMKGLKNPEEVYRIIKNRIGVIARPPELRRPHR